MENEASSTQGQGIRDTTSSLGHSQSGIQKADVADSMKPPSVTPRLIKACKSGYYSIVTAVLECGDDVNIRDASGATPLIAACCSHTVEVRLVELLLRHGAEVNMHTNFGTSPLMLVSHYGNNDIVEALLDKGAKVNKQNNDGWSSLMAASQNGHNDVVNTLLDKGAEVNLQTLTAASENGQRGVIKTLDKGAEVNKQKLMPTSPYGHNVKTFTNLTESDTEVKMQTKLGSSSLMVASQNGHNHVVKILLEKGAEVNMQDDNGTSSLLLASRYGHNDVIKTLTDKAADVNTQDHEGWSSLMLASGHGHNNVVNTLATKGAEVNTQNNNGTSSLMCASQNGHNDVVRTLLDKGAEVNMQDNDRWTSLMFASQNGHSNIAKTLITKGAEVNTQNNGGWTSLILASRDGHIDTVKILLDNHADVRIQNEHSDNALYNAIQERHDDIADLLVAADQQGSTDSPLTCHVPDRETIIDSISQTDEQYKEVTTPEDALLPLHNQDEESRDPPKSSSEQHTLGASKIIPEDFETNKLASQHKTADQQGSTDSPLTCQAPDRESIIDSISQTDENYKDVTISDTSFQGALDKSALSPVRNQEEESQDPPKSSLEPHTLGASKIISEKKQLHSGFRHKGTTTGTPDDIALAIGIGPKQLDQSCSEDHLSTIARLLPNWMEYADPLKMTRQEINGINTDLDLTYAMKSYRLLQKWYRKNAYTERCHYRVLVEASCALGHADIAGDICTLIKENPSPIAEDSSFEHISKDLILFKEEGIGGGAYGAVFKGEMNGQPCAIKVLYPLANQIKTGEPTAKQTKQDTLDRFRNECEYFETFKHPNVVKHLATRTHPKTGLPVLALELMNCNLRQFFTGPYGKDLPFLTQKSLCRDIASALAYIHSRHIVHRDLCSDNILLDRQGKNPVAKVCDFGMSRIVTSDEMSNSLPAFGHRGYLPPEATDVTSTRFDSSYDIFSFGAIIVQIVRHLPTIKDTKERKDELDQIDYAHPLKSIIEQCLLVNRDDRPSAEQLERKMTQKSKTNFLFNDY